MSTTDGVVTTGIFVQHTYKVEEISTGRLYDPVIYRVLGPRGPTFARCHMKMHADRIAIALSLYDKLAGQDHAAGVTSRP